MLTREDMLGLGRRLLKGAVLIALGFGFLAVHNNKDAIVDSVKSYPGLHWIAHFSLDTLGIEGLGWAILAIGFIYIIAFDYIADIFFKLALLFADHFGKLGTSVGKWAETGVLPTKQLKVLLVESFTYACGVKDQMGREFGEFLRDLVIDRRQRDGVYWRSGYRTEINVENLPLGSPLAAGKYLSWRENITFTLHHAGGRKHYNFRSNSSVKADLADLPAILGGWQYRVFLENDKRFDFHALNIPIALVLQPGGYNSNGVRVYLEDDELVIKIAVEIPIALDETNWRVEERSFIMRDEPFYQLTVFEPVKGVAVDFHLGTAEYQITTASFSPTSYAETPTGVQTTQTVAGYHASTTSWIYPGIAAVVIWR